MSTSSKFCHNGKQKLFIFDSFRERFSSSCIMKILKHLIVGSIFIIFIGLVIFHEIFSENYKVSPLLEWHALIPSWGDLMMLSGLLAIGYVIESTLQVNDGF